MIKKFYGPPGTGKTEKLIRRALAYIRIGTPVKRIGYFAFTKKAALEAKERMLNKNRQFQKKDLRYFQTLHSLAFHTLGLKEENVMQDYHYNDLGKTLSISVKAKRDIDSSPYLTCDNEYFQIIIKSREKNIKVHNRFLPSGVIYYSKLYHSLSHLDLLEGSIDAIAHCIESTMSFNKNSYLDFLSTQTIEYIVKAQLIDKLIDNKIDKESDLINMSILSFNGGIAQNNAGSGICHALAHTAETVTGLGHAKCIAYFFNPVIRYLQLSNEEFNSKFNTQIIQLLCKIPEKLKSFNCFTELDKIIKNKENLPKFIDKAKNDPCWRLYRNKIDGELLMKQLLR